MGMRCEEFQKKLKKSFFAVSYAVLWEDDLHKKLLK